MKKSFLLSYSRLCAEFLGGINKDKREKDSWYLFPAFRFYKAEMVPDFLGGEYLEHDYNCNACRLSEMQFHSDWNWIMAVVQKIGKLQFGDVKGLREYIDNNFNAFQVHIFSDKEEVVQAIYNFLLWYEQTNTGKK